MGLKIGISQPGGWKNNGCSKLTSFRNVYCRVQVRRSCCTYCRALSRCRRARRCRRWGWRCRPLRGRRGGSGNSPAFPRRIPTWRYQLARCGLVRARRSFPRKTFSGANCGSSRWRWCPACNSRPCAAACCESLRIYRYDKYKSSAIFHRAKFLWQLSRDKTVNNLRVCDHILPISNRQKCEHFLFINCDDMMVKKSPLRYEKHLYWKTFRIVLRKFFLQGATITPRNFLKAGCYSVLGELFRDFSTAGYYSRSLTLPNKGVLGVIEVNGAPFLR